MSKAVEGEGKQQGHRGCVELFQRRRRRNFLVESLTMNGLSIILPLAEISQLCRRYHVMDLSIFGSALREDFRADSDVDLLVQFEPEARIGLMTYARLQRELSEAIGRPVDLVARNGLKPLVRDEVLNSVRSIYHAS